MATLAERIGSKAACTIDSYDVMLELRADGEVRATLAITYEAYDDPKSDGFKFVGADPVKDVRVTDSKGRTLKHRVEGHNESLIQWWFHEPLRNAQETVRIEFTIVGAVSGTATRCSLDASWVGRFRVPVRKSSYRVILPAGYSSTGFHGTPAMSRIAHAGAEAYDATRSASGAAPVTVWCEPSFLPSGTTPAVRRRRAPQAQGCQGAIVLAAIIGFILFVVWIVRHGTRSSSSGSGDSSYGSSSSCSSSSCSSCGGGCGGGCGGCGG